MKWASRIGRPNGMTGSGIVKAGKLVLGNDLYKRVSRYNAGKESIESQFQGDVELAVPPPTAKRLDVLMYTPYN